MVLTGSGWRHDCPHSGEGQTEDTGLRYVSRSSHNEGLRDLTEGVVDADDPGHSLLTLDGGEHLSGVLESDRSFA